MILGGLTVMLSIMLVVALRKAAKQDATSQWPSCEGMVVASRVEQSTSRKGGTSYKPKVLYRYSVNGVTREGSTISFNPRSTAREDAFTTVTDLYPVGRTIRVWYQPNDPSQTVLDTSPADWLVARLLGVVLVFVSTGFALAVFWPWLGGDQSAGKSRFPRAP